MNLILLLLLLLLLLFPLLTLIPSRYITRLLEDVVFFMIHKENPGAQRPDPLVEEGVVDRDRQKLIREQDVLKEVGGACCFATVVFISKL